MTSSGSGGALDTPNAPPVDATRPEPMGPGFAAAVSAITDAFGDPTRRSIYLYVRDRAPTEGPARGVTASSVASEVGVHPNVARHHLDKLAAGGYIEVVARASAAIGARRAGRPSKHYVAVGGASEHDLPVRSDDLVLALLGRALAELSPADAEAIAEDVGSTYGRALAAGLTGEALTSGQRSLRSAMQAVADALTAHGFAARTEQVAATPSSDQHGRLRIVNDHCPFGAVAVDHPVICAVDRGLVRGMLAALHPDGTALAVATESSKAMGDTYCATAV
jgi:predicted ArsR family transcriptional regulator